MNPRTHPISNNQSKHNQSNQHQQQSISKSIFKSKFYHFLQLIAFLRFHYRKVCITAILMQFQISSSLLLFPLAYFQFPQAHFHYL